MNLEEMKEGRTVGYKERMARAGRLGRNAGQGRGEQTSSAHRGDERDWDWALYQQAREINAFSADRSQPPPPSLPCIRGPVGSVVGSLHLIPALVTMM